MTGRLRANRTLAYFTDYSVEEVYMTDQYRRLAVFVDSPSPQNFVWIVLESTDDPAVWLDLQTSDEPLSSWIEAHEAGNAALLAYVDDEAQGPRRDNLLEDDFQENE